MWSPQPLRQSCPATDGSGEGKTPRNKLSEQMKTQAEIKAEAENLIRERVRENHKPVHSEARYRDMLDECYDFSSVGGPFAHMLPSRVLAEVDPVAYRCGKNDWMDGQDIREFDGDEWDGSDLDEAKEAVEDALESEISDTEKEIDGIRSEPEDDANEESNSERIAELQDELDELNSILAAVKAYTF